MKLMNWSKLSGLRGFVKVIGLKTALKNKISIQILLLPINICFSIFENLILE